jgi:hypothetical protein
MGTVEVYLDYCIEGDSRIPMFIGEEYKLRTTAAPLMSSVAIAAGQTETTNPDANTTQFETNVTRLYERPVLEPKHGWALQFLANPRIPRALAHRRLNQLLARIGDGDREGIGSFHRGRSRLFRRRHEWLFAWFTGHPLTIGRGISCQPARNWSIC